MILTVNTDVACNVAHRLTAYAYSIMWSKGRISKCGPLLPYAIGDEAEILCLNMALTDLQSSAFAPSQVFINVRKLSIGKRVVAGGAFLALKKKWPGVQIDFKQRGEGDGWCSKMAKKVLKQHTINL